MPDSSSSSSPSNPADHLSPGQAQFVYWFNGLFPITSCILTPLTTYRKTLTESISDVQRYNKLLHEVSRQFVSGSIGLVCYFVGGELTRKVLDATLWKGKDPSESDKHVGMIVGGAMLSFIGYTFIRPWLAMDILHTLEKKETPDGKIMDIPLANASRLKKGVISWVDNHFFQHGVPQLKGAASASSLALGGYLTALAFTIYGVSRILGGKPPQQKKVQAVVNPHIQPQTRYPIVNNSFYTQPAPTLQNPNNAPVNPYFRPLPGAYSGNPSIFNPVKSIY
jgi:hypothetical protein